MKVFKPLRFQKEAINELLDKFVILWKEEGKKLPLVFKSPTGSGKTFMVANFIRGVNHLPSWKKDKAFIWITFSDDLAMQSKEKFFEYFENNLENKLLTVNNINNGKLYENDILFLNWQKVVSKSAETRILRRPEDEMMHKETGKYWEDFIDGTHQDNREIILIIDEAHKNKSTILAQDVIDYINPKIILHITATPDDKDELESRRYESFISVDREKVVEEGLIKEKIVVQTDEDLEKYKGKDLDEVLLDLGLQKRDELREELKRLNKNINPLLLIQLPNDDKKLTELQKETKEQVVTTYLKKRGIKDKNIAKWFDGKQENMDFITEGDSDIDVMLFKQAAGTGWDCPRASVIVMFREIRSNKFYTQTIGRILRMPEPQLKEDYKNNPDLRVGYLFTNYKRNQVRIPDESEKNKALTQTSNAKKGIKNINLESAYISRISYGDIPISNKFQMSFINSMNKYFSINTKDILGGGKKKLKNKGIDTKGFLSNKIIVNAEFKDFDYIDYSFSKEGTDFDVEMSVNDVEKTFNYLCYQLLKEQTDEDAKIGNIARSWGRLKSAIRIWFKSILGDDSDYYYRIFINDVNKKDSKFRPAITQALKDFKPKISKILEEKKQKEEEKEASSFTIMNEYRYTDDYREVKQNLCVLDKFFLLNDYKGRKNELNFKEYVDSKIDHIDWWFKNGDYGKNYYAIKYFDTTEDKESLFYPDWIIRFKDGRIGVFDTKGGETANSQDTIDKAKALSEKIKGLGTSFVGGIAVFANGVWYYNNSKKYIYKKDNIGSGKDWKKFENLFKNRK